MLWCQCGPGSRFRGRVTGDGVWGKATSSVTITRFFPLPENHLILLSIYTTVRIMTWKQGWIYGRIWMWFQWSIEHFLRHFNWRCGFSVYYWYSLQVGLCDVAYYCSAGVDWYLDQIDYIKNASRTSQMFLSRFWISMYSSSAKIGRASRKNCMYSSSDLRGRTVPSYILNRIRWFTGRGENRVIVTLDVACPQTPSPVTLPLKRDPGPHWHHNIEVN